MRTVTFTEFRKQASILFSEVEHGENIIVIRHGKPIAEVIPFKKDEKDMPSWKKPALRIKHTEAEISKAILDEREMGV